MKKVRLRKISFNLFLPVIIKVEQGKPYRIFLFVKSIIKKYHNIENKL
jgi:hypothetical protein